MTTREASTPTTAATLMPATARSRLRRRSRNQQLTPTTKAAPVTQPQETVWRNFITADGESATAAKSTISLRTVSGLNSMPTGSCIQALATRIHQAESVAPSPVSQVAARWKPGRTFFQPKNMTAMKVDSMKNATMPSIASGAPKMSPTNQE